MWYNTAHVQSQQIKILSRMFTKRDFPINVFEHLQIFITNARFVDTKLLMYADVDPSVGHHLRLFAVHGRFMSPSNRFANIQYD